MKEASRHLYIDVADSLFFPATNDQYDALITSGISCSDKAWNRPSISPELHRYWSEPYWAVKYVGMLPLDQGPKWILIIRF